MSESSPVYVIQGKEVTLPVIVRHASSGVATYWVDAAAARRLLPGPELDVVELWPGRTLLSIAVIDYKDNDLGDYNEVSITFFVRERAAATGIPYLGALLDFLRGRVSTYIRHLPVNQSFTCEAGRTIWGFPKTVEEIDLSYEPNRVRCKLVADGQHVLTLSLPRGGSRNLPDSQLATYSYIEGAPHKTGFSQRAEGVGFKLGGAELELGSHPMAEELRGLGLPKRALMTVWMEKMQGRFGAAQKL